MRTVLQHKQAEEDKKKKRVKNLKNLIERFEPMIL